MGFFKDLGYVRRFEKAVRTMSRPGAKLGPVRRAIDMGARIGMHHGLSPEEAAALFSQRCGYECGLNGASGGGIDHPSEDWASKMAAEGRFSTPEALLEVAAADFEALRNEILRSTVG